MAAEFFIIQTKKLQRWLIHIPEKSLSNNQKQTKETFAYKWKKSETYNSPTVLKEWRSWLIKKYFDGDESRVNTFLSNEKMHILDAGCGAGMSALLLFGNELKKHNYIGVDVSESVEVAKKHFKEKGLPAQFYQCDLNDIPQELGDFDLIFSEGVLHHTDCVESAIRNLSKRLKPSGYFLFYVYSRKAPIREYTDDLIREEISGLSDDEAWEILKPLTLLGKQLGDLDIEIDIPEDIPYLEIEKGRHNLQRLFYYKICKAFYRPEYTLEEMNHINYDWFRPQNCHRHTPEEIKLFCEKANLVVERMHVEDSGITVVGRKFLQKSK